MKDDFLRQKRAAERVTRTYDDHALPEPVLNATVIPVRGIPARIRTVLPLGPDYTDTANQSMLATVSEDGHIRIYSRSKRGVFDGPPRITIRAPVRLVACVISLGNGLLAASGLDGRVVIMCALRGVALSTLKLCCESPINTLAKLCGNMLAAGTNKGDLFIIKRDDDGKKLSRIRRIRYAHRYGISHILNHQDNMLLTVGEDCAVGIWDINKNGIGDNGNGCIIQKRGRLLHSAPISCLAISKNKVLATATDSDSNPAEIRIYENNPEEGTFSLVRVVNGLHGFSPCVALEFLNEGRHLLSVGINGPLAITDIKAGKCFARVLTKTGPVVSACIMPKDGTLVLANVSAEKCAVVTLPRWVKWQMRTTPIADTISNYQQHLTNNTINTSLRKPVGTVITLTALGIISLLVIKRFRR